MSCMLKEVIMVLATKSKTSIGGKILGSIVDIANGKLPQVQEARIEKLDKAIDQAERQIEITSARIKEVKLRVGVEFDRLIKEAKHKHMVKELRAIQEQRNKFLNDKMWEESEQISALKVTDEEYASAVRGIQEKQQIVMDERIARDNKSRKDRLEERLATIDGLKNDIVKYNKNREKLKVLKQDKRYVGEASSVGAKLIQISTGDKGTSEEVNNIQLGDYFQPSVNGTYINNVGTALNSKEYDTSAYKNVYNTLMGGIDSMMEKRVSKNAQLYDISTGSTGDGFDNITRLLMVHNKDGKPVLPKEVKDALVISTIDWLHESANSMLAANRSDDEVRRILSISDEKTQITSEMRERAAIVDGIVAIEADSLGNKAYKYMQLKAKDSTDTVNNEWNEAKMKTELGLLQLLMAEEAGVLRLFYRNDGSKYGDMAHKAKTAIMVPNLVMGVSEWTGPMNGKYPKMGANDVQLQGMSATNTFDNPFLPKLFTSRNDVAFTMNTNNSEELAQMYYDWLKDDTVPEYYKGDEIKLEERRQWILKRTDKIVKAANNGKIYTTTPRNKFTKTTFANALYAFATGQEFRTGFQANMDSSEAIPAEELFGVSGEPVKAFKFMDIANSDYKKTKTRAKDKQQELDNRAGTASYSVRVNGTIIGNALRDTIRLVRDAVDRVKDKSGVAKTAKEAMAKVSYKNDGPSGLVSEISEWHKKAIDKQTQTEVKFIDSYMEAVHLLMGLDKDQVWSKLSNDEQDAAMIEFAKTQGYRDLDEVWIGNRESAKGKNDAILLNIRFLMEAREEHGNEGMYATWKVITNNRFMIDSNQLNWQDKKLHRHAVKTADVAVTDEEIILDGDIKTGTTTKDMFKYAVAQGWGLGTDKLSKEELLLQYEEKAEEIWADISNDDGEVDSDKFVAVYTKMAKETEPTHLLMALSEFGRYMEWMNGDMKEEFTSGIRLETDDTTSGYILKLLQMPVFMKNGKLDISKTYEEIARGGVTDTADEEKFNYGSMAERRKIEGMQDSYEKPAALVAEQLDKLLNAKDGLSKEAKDGLITAIEMLDGKVETTTDGNDNITGYKVVITRSMMKNPFMILNYGAGVAKIVGGLVTSALFGSTISGTKGIGGLLEDIEAVGQINGTAEEMDEKEAKREVLEKKLKGLVSLLYAEEDKDAEEVVAMVNKRYNKIWDSLWNQSEDDVYANYKPGSALLLRPFTANEYKTMESNLFNMLKDPIGDTFNNTYKELIEAAGTINESITAEMRIGKIALDRAIEDEMHKRRLRVREAEIASKVDAGMGRTKAEKDYGDKLPRVAPLTEGEITKLVKELSKIFPVFNSALKIKESEDEKSKIFIAGMAKSGVHDYKWSNTNNKGSIREGREKQLNASISIRGLIEKYSSGAVVPIHFLDGARQAMLLAINEALGVHDANYSSIDKVLHNTKEANRLVYELSRDYSLTTEILKSFVDTLVHSKADVLNEYIKDEMSTALNSSNYLVKQLGKFNDEVIDEIVDAMRDGKLDQYVYNMAFAVEKKEDTETVYDIVLATIAGVMLGRKLDGLTELQKNSENGREIIFNNGKLRVEHAFLDGAQFEPKIVDGKTGYGEYNKYEKKYVDTGKAKKKLEKIISMPDVMEYGEVEHAVYNGHIDKARTEIKDSIMAVLNGNQADRVVMRAVLRETLNKSKDDGTHSTTWVEELLDECIKG